MGSGGDFVELELQRLRERIVRCRRCKRLVWYRRYVAEGRPKRYKGWKYWARPIPGFGDPYARLLVVGLAPAAHGGNRTGRMFTGDGSANTLMSALYANGYASRPTSISADDGLVLRDAYLTAVVRCVPPKNMPSKDEVERCLDYLKEEIGLLKNVKAIVALGSVAFNGCLRLMKGLGAELPKPRPRFRHGACYEPRGNVLGRKPPVIICSYHPSRQNTQTGRLTVDMLVKVFEYAKGVVKKLSF